MYSTGWNLILKVINNKKQMKRLKYFCDVSIQNGSESESEYEFKREK